jgi:tetratricopeptide (TPR) repeat protein
MKIQRLAPLALIVVVTAALAFLSKTIFAQARPKTSASPLKLQDAVLWLGSGMPSSSVEKMVKARGADFKMDGLARTAVSSCGGEEPLLAAITANPSAGASIQAIPDSAFCADAKANRSSDAADRLRAMNGMQSSAAWNFAMERELFGEGEEEEGYQRLQKAADLEPDVIEIKTDIANFWFRAGDVDRATSLSRAAIAADPQSYEAHLAFGHALSMTPGNEQTSIAEYREAVRLMPDSTRSWGSLSSALENIGDVNGADEAYKHGIAGNPASWYLHYKYARFLDKAKQDYDGSIAQYREARKNNPSEPTILNNLGGELCDTKKYEEAVEVFKDLFLRFPDWQNARECYAKSLYWTKNFDEAIVQARDVLNYDPDNVKAHRYLGLSLISTNHPEEGLGNLMTALQGSPGVADYHLDVARALRINHRDDEAIPHYREASRLDPNSPAPHIELGNVLNNKGLEKEAVEEFEKATPLIAAPAYAEWVAGLRKKLDEKTSLQKTTKK